MSTKVISTLVSQVKLTLDGSGLAGFIKAIKRYKTDKNANALGHQINSSFKLEDIPRCLSGENIRITAYGTLEIKKN